MPTIDDTLRKIQALLDKADSTTFPEEAKTFRAKAEILMHKYRIEEAMLAKADPVGIAPVWKDIVLCSLDNEWKDYLYSMFTAAARHMDVRYTTGWIDGSYVLHCVGYESDLRFMEALYASARVAFNGRLDPDVDPDASDQQNAYALRMAGWTGKSIALALWGTEEKSQRVKARKLFAKEATARGEDPSVLLGRDTNVKTFRMSYASGFISEYQYRLRAMRTERGEESTGLVLAGRKEAVNEAFYERYPNYRPVKTSGSIGDGYETCAKCAKAKSGACRDHSWRRARAPKAQAFDSNAYASGRAAARDVDLGTRGRLS